MDYTLLNKVKMINYFDGYNLINKIILFFFFFINNIFYKKKKKKKKNIL